MTDNNKPSWLSNDAKVEGGAATIEEYEDPNSSPNATFATPPTSSRDENKESRVGCFGFLIIFICACFCIIFVYSSVVQDNDLENSRMWKFFYAMSAALPGAYILARFCCRSATFFIKAPLGMLAFGIVVWSSVLIVFASIELADSTDNSSSSNSNSTDTKEGGDSDNFTDRTEKILEVAGASLCLFSALFHMVLLKCYP